MLQSIFGFLLSVSAIQVQAATLASPAIPVTPAETCAPSVQAMPTYLYCRSGNVSVAVTIETLMSPAIPACQGQLRREVKSATVEIRPEGEPVLLTLSLNDDEFSYSYGMGGTSGPTFRSPKHGLELNDCVTPAHGGVSIGNGH